MSKEVEQRVVEMRFDNKQFESNVSTTMSTLDKLKQKLNFKGSSKGLEDISYAAKKVDMNGLAKGIETVQMKFSALQVIGVTALANITNSAVNAGKRIASALTIDPIKTGFQEYETQINAIQTILANTQSKGSTLEDVTAALDELNKYADMTIYNFTEMTRNIGTFTAAGVDLDKSVTSIKGIANLAAVSGSNAQQASTAMYQLSQALAAGKVQLMDWNSVVNAGMGGELFQNALKRTATQMGTNVDALIKKYGSFRESLTKGGWLTAEVLTETLTQLSGAYTEADLIAQGYSESQAKEITQLAQTAVDAATKVKTFTQLWDTLKEAAQSGWTQTWEIIIGDFEEAKEFLTGLSDLFGGIIQRYSDARNNLLEGALGSKWPQLTKQINEAGVATEDFNSELEKTVKSHNLNVDQLVKEYGSLEKAFAKGAISTDLIVETLKRMAGASGTTAKATEDMTGKLEYFQKVVNEVWHGDYKNGEERVKALTAAGYDYAQVQSLVNKTVDGHKLTLEDLSDTQLKSVGYTQEEITKLRELADQAEKTGTPLNELINDLSKPTGRELLLDSVMNVIHSIINSVGAVHRAWQSIFPPMQSTQLYNIIEGVNTLTKSLYVNEDTADKITRTFKGLFAILDIISTLVGGGFKLAFQVFSKVLGAFDMDVLDFTAHVGDMLVGFRNFVLDNELVTQGIEILASAFVAAADALERWFKAFKNLPSTQAMIKNLQNNLSKLKEIGENAIEGFQNGLKEGLTSIPQLLVQIGKTLLQAIKDVLGIHSPSTEMYDVATNAVRGLANGFTDGIDIIVSALKTIGSKCLEVMKSIDWGAVLAIGVNIALLYFAKQLIGVASAITAPLEGLGDVLSGFGNVLDSYAKNIKANAIKNIAISIAILAGSVFLLAQLDAGKLWSSIGALGALAGIIALLSFSVGKFGPDKAVSFGSFALALVGISASLLLISFAVKNLDSLDPESAAVTVTAFVGMVAALMGLVAVYGKFVNGEASKNISKLGSMMIKLSISLLLLTAVVKIISGMSAQELIKGGAAITAFVGIVGLLSLITKTTTPFIGGLGKTMVQLSISMLLMIAVIKLISGMSAQELIKGGAAITAFVGIVGLLSLVTRSAGATKGLGTALLGMSASMLIMVGVMKLISTMSAAEMVKGFAAITVFTGMLTFMTKALGKLQGQSPKIAITLLAMSVSLGIMAGIAVLLSLIDISGLAKGVTAVSLLAGLMTLLIRSTKGATDVKGNLIVMTIAIAALAASAAALSFVQPDRLYGATAALSILIGMFALLVKSSATVKGSLGTLITMTVAIGMLGGVIYLLAQLPVESVLTTAVSLSVLLVALSASMRILSKAGAVAPTTIVALGALTLAVAGLAAILGVLDHLNVEPSIDTAVALSTLLLALSGACVILAAVGKIGAGAALQGALALDGVILVIGGLMAGIGALVAYFPQLEEFVDNGVGLLESVGRGIGSFVGGIAGGIMSGVTSGLPSVGTNLSAFMTNLTPFVEGTKNISKSSVDAVRSLAEMILLLTAGNIVNGIASFFGLGGSSLEDFAGQLKPFGEAMGEFGESIKGKIDAESMTAVSTAGKMLAELNRSLPRQGGALQDFLGSKDLGSFGSQLQAFGEAIVAFSQTVAPNGKLQVNQEAAEAAANAGKTIADLNSSLPRQGGALQEFLGSQDLGVFSSQMKAFGEAIVNFSQTIAPNGQTLVNQTAVESAASAGKVIAELNTSLPRQGGILQEFLGSQDLQTFGMQLKAFGTAIVDFSKVVSADGSINPTAIETTKTAAAMMVELNNTLPNQGGLFSLFNGSQSMATFGEELVAFGRSFSTYCSYIQNVNPVVVSATGSAAQSLVTLANSLPDNKLFSNDTTLEDFGKQLSKFGSHFATFYANISDINTFKLSSAVREMSNLISIAKGVSGIDFGPLGEFGTSLKKLGASGVDGFISAFENATTRVQAAASSMIAAYINTVNARQEDLATSCKSMVDRAISAMESMKSILVQEGGNLIVYLTDGAAQKGQKFSSTITSMVSYTYGAIRKEYNNFHSAGAYLVDGLAKGIKDNTWKAEAQARTLAAAVDKATRNVLEIHSPSKVSNETGGYYVEGLVQGIDENLPTAKDAGASLGAGATSGLEEYLQANPMGSLGAEMDEDLASGISSNTSAEEAATQKAQSVASAYQKELDALDLDDTTANLEHQLWTNTEGKTASESEKLVKDAEELTSQLKTQTERVNIADTEYQESIIKFGETAEETQEAYNKLLQEKIAMSELSSQLSDIQKEEFEKNKESVDAYIEWMKASADDLLKLGFTSAQISSAAKEDTGYSGGISLDYSNASGGWTKEEMEEGFNTAQKTTEKISSNLGAAISEGISNGIKSTASSATNAASEMALSTVKAAKSVLKVNSPSKEFYKVGSFAGEGFINAFADYQTKSYEAGSGIANYAIDGLNNAIARLRDAMEGGIDAQPVIRPVLDLSAVESDASRLNAMFSRTQATAISSHMTARAQTDSQNGVTESTPKGASYQFVQNNYSPKALSRVEIYRQTKNQFSAFERVTTT